jgi:hypothetical protein
MALWWRTWVASPANAGDVARRLPPGEADLFEIRKANVLNHRYWFGAPDVNGRNLATCVWRCKEDARIGGVGPAHRRASAATRHLYAEWGIDRFALKVEDSISSWKLVRWED